MQAARLLFDQPDSTEPSIFGKPSELAAFVVERDLYSGKVPSVSAFLSQVIQRGERSCPERLKEAICEAVRLKLKEEGQPPEEREQQAERVRRALEVDDLVRRTPQPMNAEGLYFELQNLALSAAEHYIITAKPAEQVVSDRAATLRGILLQRLGLSTLYEEDSPKSRTRPQNPDTRYSFCLPSEDAAKRYWRALFHEIRSETQAAHIPFDQKRVNRALEHLDEIDALRVFVVPPYLCGCPVVVFDPNKPEPNGFVLYYHHTGDLPGRRDLVSVARMDAMYLQMWKELVHSPLEVDEIDRKRVRFRDVRDERG